MASTFGDDPLAKVHKALQSQESPPNPGRDALPGALGARPPLTTWEHRRAQPTAHSPRAEPDGGCGGGETQPPGQSAATPTC